MTKGIESKSVDVAVGTIKEAVENAGLNTLHLLQLYRVFGRNGIDEIIKTGSAKLNGQLPNWPREDIHSLKRGIYPNNFSPKDKK